MPQFEAHLPVRVNGLPVFGEGNFVDFIRISRDEIVIKPAWTLNGHPGGFVFRFTGMMLDTPQGEATKLEVFYNEMPYFTISDLSLTIADIKEVGQLGMQKVLAGHDQVFGTSEADGLIGGDGYDEIFGFEGNDYIHGQDQADYLAAGKGDDTVRGGKGHDELIGGLGADYLWGGEGANELWAGPGRTAFRSGLEDGADGDPDQLYVPADSILNPKGNPGGLNRDLIFQADLNDKIFIHGVSDSSLSYQSGILDPRGTGYSGVGIFANGILEAIVVSSQLSAFDVSQMTKGGFFA